MQMIEKTLLQVEIGSGVAFNNLTIIPLIAANQGEPDYLTLDEALAWNQVQVTETSEAGNVPELRLINRGQQAILLLDGEEVVGAKQNRILNLTILVPPMSKMTIPVSCVEAGRWAHSSREFSSEGRAFYAEGRARKAAQVTGSLRARGARSSEQGAVWADIAEKAQRMNSHSDTAAMACMYEDYQHSIGNYQNAIKAIEGQVGAVFAINGQIRGLELFDFAATFHKLMPKLVGSYALDTIDEQGDSAADAPLEVGRFLAAVAAAEGSVHPAVGEGEDIRISSPGLTGGALHARERIVHLCAFATRGTDSGIKRRETALTRSRQRMRRYQDRED